MEKSYEEYIEIVKQIEELEAKKEVLRTDIAKILPAEGFRTDAISAFWTLKKKWTYSPKVEGLTAELKATKKKEEEEGTAISEEERQLTIKVK